MTTYLVITLHQQENNSNLMNPPKDAGRSTKTGFGSRRLNNALQAGILAYLTSSHRPVLNTKTLPKRYTTYPPLLLLPVNFISTSPEWKNEYESLDDGEKNDLFAAIVAAFRPQVITNIAINAAISLESDNITGSDNVMRSPSGITPVYGDFGPSELLQANANRGQPTESDHDAAFWVSTTQNRGIVQTWAPRWTMFSRGNITEKARILGEAHGMRGLVRKELGEDLGKVVVADLYVGIGYFAFSYLRRGVKAVFGWEINGWSVEGLKRGCQKNGWDCVVVKITENGTLEDGGAERIIQCLQMRHGGKCIVLWGDNKSAARLLRQIRARYREFAEQDLDVRHVNLGLLPTARASWLNAAQLLHPSHVGWIHVHENVDINHITAKRLEIVAEFDKLVQTEHEGSWEVSCCHVEQVKTYAPGVMHCVFDIEVSAK